MEELYIQEKYDEIYNLYNKNKNQAHEILKLACKYDSHVILTWLNQKGELLKREYLNIAIKNLSYAIINYLLKHGLLVTEIEVSLAIDVNSVQILKKFKKNGTVYNPYHTILSAEKDKLECLIYFKEIGILFDNTIGIIAGPNTLRWICDNGPYNELMGNHVIETLNDLTVLIKLYEGNKVKIYNQESILIAAEKNNVEIIKWLRAIGIPIKDELYLYANSHDKTLIIDWLKASDLVKTKIRTSSSLNSLPSLGEIPQNNEVINLKSSHKMRSVSSSSDIRKLKK
jgi:hypothetical protein